MIKMSNNRCLAQAHSVHKVVDSSLVFVDCFCRISLILQLLIITHRGDEVRLIILMCGQTKDGLPNSFKYVASQGCLVGVVVLPPVSLTGLLMTVTVTLCPSQLLFTYSSQGILDREDPM